LKKEKYFLLFYILLILIILTGCFKDENQSDIGNKFNEEKVKIKAKESREKKFPVKVINYDKTELCIYGKPKKIASLTLGTDEMLLELVDEGRVAGLSGKKADDQITSNVAEKSKLFPKIENDLEVIISQKSDLVIGSSWIKPGIVQKLKKIGIPYYGYKTPKTIEEQKQVILDLSKILGEEEKGINIVKDIDKRLDRLYKKINEVPHNKKLRVMAYNKYGSSNAKGTIFDDIIQKLGVINVTSEAGLKKVAKASPEKIIGFNPDVIILLAWEKDDPENFFEFAEQFKSNKTFGSVNAIKNDRVYVMSSKYLTSSSHHIIEGIEVIAEFLYPDIF